KRIARFPDVVKRSKTAPGPKDPHAALECASRICCEIEAPPGIADACFVTRHLCRNDDSGVVTLTLDVPQKRNALTAELRQELLETLRQDEADPSVRAIILTGAGGCFCSGGDIKLMGEGGAEDRRARLAVL